MKCYKLIYIYIFYLERCQNVECGVGSRCDENTGNCVCLPYFIGNPAMLCVPRKYIFRYFIVYICGSDN